MSAKHFLGGAAVGAGLVYFLDSGGARSATTPVRRPPRRPQGLEAANLGRSRTPADVGGARAGRGCRSGGVRNAATGPDGCLAPDPGAGNRRQRASALRPTAHAGRAPPDRRHSEDACTSRRRSTACTRSGRTYDNFPLFMTNVRQVQDLGEGRSRWVVSGPGRRELQWNAVVTGREENRCWPGAASRDRSSTMPAPSGSAPKIGTRIDVRFCYSPPTGRAGRAVAEFFGGDPRTRLNQDLGAAQDAARDHRTE